MKVEKGTVRAPEIGRTWLNSPPLSLRQLRGQAVLIDFWDYTCVNCIRTLPYVQQWHERYAAHGLTVIGVHTPEFTFAQYESNVERGIREFGLTYPVVIDSDLELWKLFANRFWPSKYLIDGEGYLRWAHFGEGAYHSTEAAIQELLRELNAAAALPPLMEPVRAEDREGAVCYAASPETYLGHRRGRCGNPGGLHEGAIAEYDFPASLELEESYFYLRGRWAITAEYAEAVGDGPHSIVIHYAAAGVNLVLASPRHPQAELVLLQDGKPLTPLQGAPDLRFRQTLAGVDSFVAVDRARMYQLLQNPDFGRHTLELQCSEGVAAFAFTFNSCLDPRHASNKGVSAR